MLLTTEKYEYGKLVSNLSEYVDYQYYINCKNDMNFYRSLGGKEKLMSRENKKVLTSISPDGTIKIVRTWIV